jgi:hypothetical protein
MKKISRFSIGLLLAFTALGGFLECAAVVDTTTAPAYAPEFTGTWSQDVAGGTHKIEANGSTITYRSTVPATAGYYTMTITSYDESLNRIYAAITSKSTYYTLFTGSRWIIYSISSNQLLWQESLTSFADAATLAQIGPYIKQ